MKAVVLAGGRGTRLYPLTFTRPKILVPLLNRPVLDYVLDWLKEGFDEIILACGQMRGGLRAYLETIDIKTKLNVVFEEAPLGTAGAIKNLETVLDEPFLVMNGDIISSLSVEEFLSFAMEKDGIGSIALFPSDHPKDYGVVELNEDLRITRFIEKPASGESSSNLVNAGVYFLDPTILETIEPGRMVSMEREVFPFVLDKGLYGFRLEGYWTDVGKISTYLEANRLLLQRKGSTFEDSSDLGGKVQILHPLCVGRGTSMGSGSLGPSVTIGKDCIIDSARIRNSILFDAVKVGKNTLISDSVIGEGASIEDDCSLEGCAVADWERIRKGSNLTNEKVGMR